MAFAPPEEPYDHSPYRPSETRVIEPSTDAKKLQIIADGLLEMADVLSVDGYDITPKQLEQWSAVLMGIAIKMSQSLPPDGAPESSRR